MAMTHETLRIVGDDAEIVGSAARPQKPKLMHGEGLTRLETAGRDEPSRTSDYARVVPILDTQVTGRRSDKQVKQKRSTNGGVRSQVGRKAGTGVSRTWTSEVV